MKGTQFLLLLFKQTCLFIFMSYFRLGPIITLLHDFFFFFFLFLLSLGSFLQFASWFVSPPYECKKSFSYLNHLFYVCICMTHKIILSHTINFPHISSSSKHWKELGKNLLAFTTVMSNVHSLLANQPVLVKSLVKSLSLQAPCGDWRRIRKIS